MIDKYVARHVPGECSILVDGLSKNIHWVARTLNEQDARIAKLAAHIDVIESENRERACLELDANGTIETLRARLKELGGTL